MSGIRENVRRERGRERGITMIELLVVIAVISVVAALAIPNLVRLQRNARLNGDAHNLAEVLSIAKMRAAANFTESRVFLFTGTDKLQYFRVDVWSKTANGTGSAGCWVPDAVVNPSTNGSDCIGNSSYKGGEDFLSTGVSAGYGSLSTSPDTTVTFAQATACKQGQSGPTATDGSTISDTSCIQFNSRGFPTASGGFYVTDGTRVYGIIANSMGSIHSYVSGASTATWKAY